MFDMLEQERIELLSDIVGFVFCDDVYCVHGFAGTGGLCTTCYSDALYGPECKVFDIDSFR